MNHHNWLCGCTRSDLNSCGRCKCCETHCVCWDREEEEPRPMTHEEARKLAKSIHGKHHF